MSGMTAPVRFLGAVLVGWAGIRIAFWAPLEPPGAKFFNAAAPVPPVAAARPEQQPLAQAVAAARSRPPIVFPIRRSAHAFIVPAAADPGARPATSASAPIRHTSLRYAAFMAAAGQPRPVPLSVPIASPLASPAPRWRFSAWTLWNPAGDGGRFAGNGLLGGSQAGLRAQYRLARPGGVDLALSARISRPIERRGAEAAIGIAARPLRHAPIELVAERRIAIERGGRDAWAIGAAGGVDRLALPLDIELDGYAQAGIVGARDRDLYGDAALAVTRPFPIGERMTLSLGGGAWASAQPDAARVDIGPQAVLRVPAGETSLRVALGWRQRVAGGAAPGSGPVVTLATDF